MAAKIRLMVLQAGRRPTCLQPGTPNGCTWAARYLIARWRRATNPTPSGAGGREIQAASSRELWTPALAPELRQASRSKHTTRVDAYPKAIVLHVLRAMLRQARRDRACQKPQNASTHEEAALKAWCQPQPSLGGRTEAILPSRTAHFGSFCCFDSKLFSGPVVQAPALDLPPDFGKRGIRQKTLGGCPAGCCSKCMPNLAECASAGPKLCGCSRQCPWASGRQSAGRPPAHVAPA